MMEQFIGKLFDFRDEEIPRVLWLGTIIVTSSPVCAIVANYTDAALLEQYGPHYIPWLWIAASLITMAAVAVMTRLDAVIPQFSQYATLRAGVAAAFVLLFVLIEAGIKESLLVARLLLNVYMSLATLYVWNMAGDLFDTRQSKRIFPFVTAAYVISRAAGSFCTKPLWLLLGGPFTLLVAAVVWLVSARYIARTGSGFFGASATSQHKGLDSPQWTLTEVLGLIRAYPIVRYLVITTVLGNFCVPVLHYLFMSIVHATYLSEHLMVTFLSVFRAVTTLVTFGLISSFKRIYSRMDLSVAALISPINLGAIFFAIGSFFSIYVAGYAKFSTQLILSSISMPAQAVLFGLLPDRVAAWMRTFIRGTCLRLGTLLGCVFLLASKLVMHDQVIAQVSLIPVLMWTWEALLLRKRYREILRSKLSESVRVSHEKGSPSKGRGRRLLVEPRPLALPVGLWDLEIHPEENLHDMSSDDALQLLDTPDMQRRAQAVAVCAIHRDMRAVPKLMKNLDDEDPHIRTLAVDSLSRYESRVLPLVEESLLMASPLAQQSILLIMRNLESRAFQPFPYVKSKLLHVYQHLAYRQCLSTLESSPAVDLLTSWIEEENGRRLGLVLQALSVNDRDMHLIHDALSTDQASLAVELLQRSIGKEWARILIPLLDGSSIQEKIEKGSRAFDLVRHAGPEQVLAALADSTNPISRLLALYVASEGISRKNLIPWLEKFLDDDDELVREMAQYALKRMHGHEREVPDFIRVIEQLKHFRLFTGTSILGRFSVCRYIRTFRLKKRDSLGHTKESWPGLLLVVSGKMLVILHYGRPEQRTVEALSSGSATLGWMFSDESSSHVTITASEDSEILVLDSDRFKEMMTRFPQIGINACRTLIHSLIEKGEDLHT
jgi:HEAT repeat protein